MSICSYDILHDHRIRKISIWKSLYEEEKVLFFYQKVLKEIFHSIGTNDPRGYHELFFVTIQLC